jgi:hypothetical protein
MAIALPVVNGADSLALVIEASTTLLALIAVKPSLSPVMEPAAMSAAITELFAILLVLMRESAIFIRFFYVIFMLAIIIVPSVYCR